MRSFSTNPVRVSTPVKGQKRTFHSGLAISYFHFQCTMPLVLLDGKADLLRLVIEWLEFRDRKALSSVSKYTTRSELRQLVFSQCVLRLPPLQSVVQVAVDASKQKKTKKKTAKTDPSGDDEQTWNAYYAASFLRTLNPQLVPFIQKVHIPLSVAKRLLRMLQFVPNLQKVSFWNDVVSPLASKTQVKQITVMDVGYVNGLTSLKVLDFSAIKAVHDFDAVEVMTNLQTLDLSQSDVSDIGCLAQLRKLEVLNLRSTRVEDLSCLEQLQNLLWLDVSDTRVHDFTALRFLQRLKYLNVSRNWVQDVVPLRFLPALRTLKLCNSGSLGPLELVLNAPNLEACHLHDTMLTDLFFLAGTPKVQYLDIRRTHVVDLSPLALLNDLDTLLIDDSKLTSDFGSSELRQENARWASGLKNLRNLQILQTSAEIHEDEDFAYALPVDGSILLHFPKLQALETPALVNYDVMYPALDTLCDLQLHHWTSDDLRQLAVDSKVVNLKTLKLALPSSPEIVDLLPLDAFENLQNLELVDVLFEDLAPLASLVHLEKLDLSLKSRSKRQLARKYQREQNFSFMEALVKLEALTLAGRVDFKDASVLASLTGVKKLSLNGSKVTSLAPLAKLTQLEYLDVASTPIGSVEELESLALLEEIWIPEKVDCSFLQDALRFPRLHSLWHREHFNCLWNNHRQV